MDNKKIILEQISKHRNNFRDKNVYFLQNGEFDGLQENLLDGLQSIFELEKDEEILLISIKKEKEEGSPNEVAQTWYSTSVFTNEYLLVATFEENDIEMGISDAVAVSPWKDIEYAEITKDDDDDDVLRVHYSELDEYEDIPFEDIGIAPQTGKAYTALINDIAKNYIDVEKIAWEEIIQLFEKKDYDKALELIEKYHEKYSFDFSTYWIKAECQKGKDLPEEALKTINLAIKEYEDYYRDFILEDPNATEAEISYHEATSLLITKANILYLLSDHNQAIKLLKKAFGYETETEYKEDLMEIINDTYATFKYDFLSRYSNSETISEDEKWVDLSVEEFEKNILQEKEANFSENELKYYEAVKFCIGKNGKISPDKKNILYKEIERLNIPTERANEIEQAVLGK